MADTAKCDWQGGLHPASVCAGRCCQHSCQPSRATGSSRQPSQGVTCHTGDHHRREEETHRRSKYPCVYRHLKRHRPRASRHPGLRTNPEARRPQGCGLLDSQFPTLYLHLSTCSCSAAPTLWPCQHREAQKKGGRTPGAQTSHGARRSSISNNRPPTRSKRPARARVQQEPAARACRQQPRFPAQPQDTNQRTALGPLFTYNIQRTQRSKEAGPDAITP